MGEGGALPDQSRQFSTQPVTDPPIKQYVQYGPSRALFGGALLVCLGCLLALSIRNLLFRFVLDPRHEISTAALEAAVTRFPDSALLNRLRAQRHLREAGMRSERLEEARTHAERAALAAPWDYRVHLLAGTIQELLGNPEAAETSLREAVRRAPALVEPNWALANLLLRQGDLRAALAPLRLATLANEGLFPAAYDLLWRATRAEAAMIEVDQKALEDLLQELTGGSPRQQLRLARLLLDRGEVDLAVWSYREIPLEERRRSSQGAQWLTQLIERGESLRARQLWAEVRGSTDPSTVPLLWNGGFEGPHDPVHPHFDWQFKQSEFVQVGLDPRVFAEGRYSLQLRLTGRDTTRIEDEVRQRVVLSPGGKYRLSCLVQTRDLQRPRGPQLVVRWNGRPLGASEPLPAGTTDGWQRLFFDFQVPTESGTTEIAVIRTPKYSYDDPSRGLIWLDDLRLVAIESSPQQGGQP